MTELSDRELFAREMNWIVFVFLIVILAGVNFVLLLLPIDSAAKGVLVAVGVFINMIFWIDSFYWLRKIPDRRYLTDYYGRLAFIGNIAFLTPLRLLQIWLFYRKLRKLNVGVTDTIRVRRNSQGVLLFFLYFAIVIFQTASVLILVFESQDSMANINTSGDALWWSLVTVATVGYGDKYPITTGGRIVALFLMIVGIAMFGIFTSTLSDWFRRPRRIRSESQGTEDSNRAVTVAEMNRLIEQQNRTLQRSIDELTQKLKKFEDE